MQLERDAVSYISENYDPLIASGQMTLLDVPGGGNTEIVPGVSVEVFPGHTAQMMAVMLDSGGSRACYISDLMPTSAHLDVTWVMGYDLYPLTCIEQRKRFLSRAIPERWLVLFTHDHHHPMGYVEWGAKGKPEFVKPEEPGSEDECPWFPNQGRYPKLPSANYGWVDQTNAQKEGERRTHADRRQFEKGNDPRTPGGERPRPFPYRASKPPRYHRP